MRRAYSRYQTVEEKRNINKAVRFGILTVASLLLLVFFGIPAIAKFAAFLGDLRKTSTPIEKNDTTPPPPPTLSELPEATNQQKLSLNGSTEEGAIVKLYFNSSESEVVAGEDGKFTFNLNLINGENSISLTSKDTAGNVSQKTAGISVIFDNEPPKLDISSPGNGSSFFGAKQRQITIEGLSEANISLTINDRPIKVADDGSFTYATTLNEGNNDFFVKATDKAENATELKISVSYSP